MKFFEKLTNGLSGSLHFIAGWAVVGMVALTTLDVILRYLRMPVPFMHDMVYLLSGIAVSFALARTTADKGHVAVSIIVGRFPEKWQHRIDAVTSLLGIFLFVMATWRLFIMGQDFRQAGETAMSSAIPLYPFAYGMCLATFVVCLVLAGAFAGHLKKVLD